MSGDTTPRLSHEDPDLAKYFMGIALLCAKRSKDPRTQVGACVVKEDEHRVIGTGYNGMPLNCHDCLMPWGEEKYDYVCHAEMNAIVNKDPKSVEGCTLYVTLSPCEECAKVIVRSGIKTVVYLSERKDKTFVAGEKILSLGKVERIPFKSLEEKHVLDFFQEKTDERSKVKTTQEKQIISWEQFFIGLAKLSADLRSTKPKQGACVVNEENRIVGLGYVDVSHAPIVAIVKKNPTSLRNCTLYVTNHPCKECAKVIVQSGIRRIVYLEKLDENSMCDDCCVVQPPLKPAGEKKVDAATKMFAIAHIKVEKYQPKVDFEDIKNPTEYARVELDFAKVVARNTNE